jgi:hypothetical protein
MPGVVHDGDDVKIKAVDSGGEPREIRAIQIGSEWDLGVQAQVTAAISGMFNVSPKMRYDDMNAGSGGVARGTSIVQDAAETTVYSYSGSGLFFGFQMKMQNASTPPNDWEIFLSIDSNNIFGTGGISTIDMTSVYNIDATGPHQFDTLGVDIKGDSVYFETTHLSPIKYETNVTIKVKKTGSGGNKTFDGGLALLTKET